MSAAGRVRSARQAMFRLAVAGLALALIIAACAVAADRDNGVGDKAADFRAVKGAIQQLLRSKRASDRIDGLAQLEKFSAPDAVKLALSVGTKDESSEVRQAAYLALGAMAENPQVSKTLLESVEREMRRKEPGDASVPLLGALLAAKNERVFQDASTLLDKMVETAPGARLMAVELTDQLAEGGREDDVALLVRLSTTAAFEHLFGFRRSVMMALVAIDTKPAIGAIIGLLGKVDGEAQADAIKYLTAVTSQPLGNNQEAWAKWWGENQSQFVIPPPSSRKLPAAQTVSPGVTMYYDLPIYARRMVFVMDTSRSMLGDRLVAAKKELSGAIEGLRPEDQFTVLVFDSNVRAWQKKLVPADVTNKKKAVQFVKKQETNLQTASFDALEAALGYDAEAIFFLTDGAPHGGKISAPVEIVRAISLMNRYRRESIYAIGIGAGQIGSPMDTFLRELSESNYGVYRRVDEIPR
ncbi:MAG TPA: VWA domain-containing protein [Pirellulales bacterium]|nr:VWA domain-containing protein [Pirellulales bacterium]